MLSTTDKTTFPHPPVDTELKTPTAKTTYPAEKSTCPLTGHPEPTDKRSCE